MPTRAKEGQAVVIERIINSIKEVINNVEIEENKIKAIGVGCPGPLNVKEGIIYDAPNLGWQNVNIKQVLESRVEAPVFIENDANAAALGEKCFGAGRGKDNLIYITVSTGIGGGIIIDGDLYHGSNGSAGELGHVIIDPHSSEKCG